MQKLILFIHGLGGDKDTWGKFPEFIHNDSEIDNDKYTVELFEYPTSLLRLNNILKYISMYLGYLKLGSIYTKILSYTPIQKRLPTIQYISKALNSKIERSYSHYDEIHLITHSMGGLVAKRYLLDNVEKTNVTKALFYAVPNNGSQWAEFERLYPHEQIVQLQQNSEFLQTLNEDWAKGDLESITMRYVVSHADAIVSVASAQEQYGNDNVEYLFNLGHKEMVKPQSTEDDSYDIFKTFIQGTDDKFITQVIQKLTAEQLVVLFYQNHTDIRDAKRALRAKAKGRFHTIYDFKVPSTTSYQEYFKALGEVFGVEVNSSNDLSRYIKSRLDSDEEIFLYVTDSL